MRRVVIGGMAVGLVAVVSACGPAPVTFRPSAASASSVATPSVAGPIDDATPSSAPSSSVRPVQPPGRPTTFTGSGDAVLHIVKPAGATAVIATIDGNAAGHNFDIRGLDGERDVLVRTTAPYHGSTLLDGQRGGTTQLRVHAAGPWTITLSDPRTAPVLNSGYSGSGDAVLAYLGRGGTASVKGGAAGQPFVIRQVASGVLHGDILRTTGPYAGSIHWPGGTALIVVTAVGPWSIDVS